MTDALGIAIVEIIICFDTGLDGMRFSWREKYFTGEDLCRNRLRDR
jgi:hypothetical protein